MTTPNEELLASLTQTNQFHESADICTADVIAVLQSQAERIKELERESETHSKAYGLAIVERDNLRHELKTAQEGWRCECSTDDACRFARERDALRAQLDAIAATEPVLVVEKEPDYWSGGHFHEGSKPHVKPTKVWSLPIGTKLFTRPMPAQDVTLSLTDAEIAEVQASDPAYMTCSCMKFAWDILAAANAKGAK